MKKNSKKTKPTATSLKMDSRQLKESLALYIHNSTPELWGLYDMLFCLEAAFGELESRTLIRRSSRRRDKSASLTPGN